MKPEAVALLVLSPLLIHCAKAPEPEEVEAVRVENSELGLAIAALPEPFEVVSASGESIELSAPGPGGSGSLVMTAGAEETFGINLVDEVKARKAAFEEAAGGTYFGNRELGTPIGTAFTARGGYEGEAGPVEETWVYAIHPTANRLLTITYTYPVGKSSERVNQLLLLLGEIEGLAEAQAG